MPFRLTYIIMGFLSSIKELFSSPASNKEAKQPEEKKEEPTVAPVVLTEEKTADEEHKSYRRHRSNRFSRDNEQREGRKSRFNGTRNSRRTRPERNDDEANSTETPAEPLTPEQQTEVLNNLKDFTLYVAKSLVAAPEQVEAQILEKESTSVIMLSCEKKDTGKLIGKNGKIIASIRVLVNGAAGKAGIHATVDIQD